MKHAYSANNGLFQTRQATVPPFRFDANGFRIDNVHILVVLAQWLRPCPLTLVKTQATALSSFYSALSVKTVRFSPERNQSPNARPS